MRLPQGAYDGLTLIAFSDQPVAELLRSSEGPALQMWQPLVEAQAAVEAGDRVRAEATLRSMIAKQGAESRYRLQGWAALREFGFPIADEVAADVLGVIAEFPRADGIDFVAAYRDGRIRLFSINGAVLLWEKPRPIRVAVHLLALAATAAPAVPVAKAAGGAAQPKKAARLTLLTPAGRRVIREAAENDAATQKLFRRARQLLAELESKAR